VLAKKSRGVVFSVEKAWVHLTVTGWKYKCVVLEVLTVKMTILVVGAILVVGVIHFRLNILFSNNFSNSDPLKANL
jgi:hypothetical protein